MKTIVVNKYKEPFQVDISRKSIWGNPYSHNENSNARWIVATREEAIAKYKTWILGQPNLLANLYDLKGKVLGCTCKPKSCHGDILAELADSLPDIDDHSEPLEVYW